jgi:hypothetical protein
MLTAHVTYSRDGYRLCVSAAPLWAVVAEAVAGELCTRLGHPLCQAQWPATFALGQWLLSPAARRQQERWSAPLSEARVRMTIPESVIDAE